MACTICPDCRGSGVIHADCRGQFLTWCRTCSGWGLQREAEDDDERDPVILLWPESIRWKDCA